MEDIIVKSLIIKSLIGLTIGLGFCGPTHAAESDSIATPTDSVITVEATPDTLPACSADIHGSTDHSEPVTPYTRRTERFRRGWNHLIPNQTSFQVAGGIGAFSIGIGWYYGRREQWETDVLWGFVPKANGDDMHQTLTVKQRFVPWHLPLFKSRRWTAEPLTAGAFINCIFGEGFWEKAPSKYTKGYYGFNTKVRYNLFVGQRLRYNIPRRHRRFNRSVSFYYELSMSDLYLVSSIPNKQISFFETLTLALGLRFQVF